MKFKKGDRVTQEYDHFKDLVGKKLIISMAERAYGGKQWLYFKGCNPDAGYSSNCFHLKKDNKLYKTILL